MNQPQRSQPSSPDDTPERWYERPVYLLAAFAVVGVVLALAVVMLQRFGVEF